MIRIHIEYKGSSKILKKLCWAVNWLSENAGGDMLKEVYDTNGNGIVDNAEKVNDHNVYKDVPSDAKFTDTVYDDTQIKGQVKANQDNIDMIISQLFQSDEHYIIDSDGKYLVDSDGYYIYSAMYYSKLIELQNQLNNLLSRKYVYSDGSYDDPNG